MENSPPAGSSADELAHALASTRGRLALIADEQERARRAEAIARLAQYVDLLRDATDGGQARYSFKLVFADGRWTLAEKELPALPRIGELVELAEGDSWRIRDTQLVPARPPGKPPRRFFVCTPAA